MAIGCCCLAVISPELIDQARPKEKIDMEDDRRPDDTNDEDTKESEVESSGTEPGSGEPDPGGGDVIIIK